MIRFPENAVRSELISLVAVATGVASLVFSFLQVKGEWIDSYLIAWLYWTGISSGSLSLLLLHNLTGGAWGNAIRPVMGAAAAMLPVMAILFLPVLIQPQRLYHWADNSAVQGDLVLQHKQPYLNVHFFQLRAGIYFFLWIAVLILLAWQSRLSVNSEVGRRTGVFSGQALALHGLAVTFGAIDWVMSLEPHWFSTIYGALLFVSQGLAALAFAIVITACCARRMPELNEAQVDALHDLGKLLLAFIMLWAYLSFSQFLIIWYGNLPEEVIWYTRRLQGPWKWLAFSLVGFHFIIPFALLLGRTWKRDPKKLSTVAAVIVLMHWIETIWFVTPAVEHSGHLPLLWITGFTFSIGGLWYGLFAFLLVRFARRSQMSAGTEVRHV